MLLDVQDKEIQDPTDADIDRELRWCEDGNTDYARIHSSEGENAYIQVPMEMDTLEYCENLKGPVYSAVETPDLEGIIAIFQAYNRRDPSWKTAVEWQIEIAELWPYG